MSSSGPRSPERSRNSGSRSPSRALSPNTAEAHLRGSGKIFTPGPGAYTPAVRPMCAWRHACVHVHGGAGD